MAEVHVLAENIDVFNRFIIDSKGAKKHFDYIESYNSLFGRRGVVLLVGRWWRNPNYRNDFFVEELNSKILSGLFSVVNVSLKNEEISDLLYR